MAQSARIAEPGRSPCQPRTCGWCRWALPVPRPVPGPGPSDHPIIPPPRVGRNVSAMSSNWAVNAPCWPAH